MRKLDLLKYDENLEYFILGLTIGADPELFGHKAITFENGWVLIE